MKTFDSEKQTVNSRAVQVWQILVVMAYNRQTIPYGKLARLLDSKGARPMARWMGSILDPIMKYCKLNGLPPLTVLVVGKDSGVPGKGLITITDADSERELVYGYNWFNVYPPNKTEFEEAKKAKL